MTTAMADAPVRTASRSVTRERSIDEIIASARRKPSGVRGAFWPAAVTSVLLWCSFTPLDFGPLAWIALVPLLLLIRVPRLSGRSYVAAWLGSCLFTFPALQWMRLGDPSMYIAWIALAAYVAMYAPVWVGITRVAVWRFGVPLVVAAPVTWVGLELFRAHLLTGFPWYFIGHTQHRWTSIVQISDVVGAYGVSFVVVAVNAALASFVTLSRLKLTGLLPETVDGASLDPADSRRARILGVAVATVLVAAVWTYGAVRLRQSAFVPGPRIALIQGNYPTSLKHDPNAFNEITRNHYAMSRLTVQHRPDAIVWPETMFRFPLFLAEPSLSDHDLAELLPQVPAERWRDASVQRELKELAGITNSSLVIGIDTFVAKKDGHDHYNSAALVSPEQGLTDRYDKLHRVPFGEYIPLRDVLPILQWFTPFGDEFGIAAGVGVHVFSIKEWRLLPLICFEDTVPQLVRSMTEAARKQGPVDVFVNLTNDGWFHGSSELDQHLITASFRCIENRTPMVRAVNTGISAFIDGNGQVRDPEVIIDLDALEKRDRKPRTSIRDPQTGRFYKQWNAAFLADVPLDPRESLYSRTGDLFAGLCAACCVLLAIAGLFRPRTAPATAPKE